MSRASGLLARATALTTPMMVAAALAFAGTAATAPATASLTVVPAETVSTTTTTARNLLAQVPGAAESNTGYDRTLFKHWIDADGDCQNTRAEVLVSESRVTPTFTTSSRCTVAKGSWYSPWDGATWTLAGDVDVDHHVPLAEAWGQGARNWTSTDRQRFANDGYAPALNAITDNVNSSKADRDPAEWLPPKASTHCTYAIYWVQVKYRWRLTADSAEKSRLSSILSGTCGDRVVTVPARAR